MPWTGESSRPPARPPSDVLTAELEPDVAAAALERIQALCRPELRLVVAPELLEQLMLSCYRQGILDQVQLERRTSAA